MTEQEGGEMLVVCGILSSPSGMTNLQRNTGQRMTTQASGISIYTHIYAHSLEWYPEFQAMFLSINTCYTYDFTCSLQLTVVESRNLGLLPCRLSTKQIREFF